MTPLSKTKFMEMIESFIEGQRCISNLFFANEMDGIKGAFFEKLSESSYDLITIKDWNNEIDIQEALTILTLFHLEASTWLEEQAKFLDEEFGVEIDIQSISRVFEKATLVLERWQDQSSPWTIQELQYFCDLSTQSIRNAKNSSGNDYLEFNEDGSVDYQVGIDWLRGRNSFKGLEQKMDDALIKVFSFTTFNSLNRLIKYRIEGLELKSISPTLKKIIETPDWNSLKPEIIISICFELAFNPNSFFEQLMKTLENENRYAFEELLKSSSYELSKNDTATSEAIKELLNGNPNKYQRHPKNKSSNKKMGVYFCKNKGVPIAHEFNLKNRQHIWLRKSDLSNEFLSNVTNGEYADILQYTDRYPDISDRTDETKGRHSALLVCEELKTAELIKITPKTMGAVYLILEQVCK